jgi:VanZ family protein
MLAPSKWRRLIGFVLTAYWAALLVGTHWPHLPAIGPENTDKVLHVTAYCGLAALLTLYVLACRKMNWRRLVFVVLVLAVAGGLDELTQPPFHRTADWNDWFADLVGIGIGSLLGVWLNTRLTRWGNNQQTKASSN